MRVGPLRLIVDPPLPGAWNMAADEALLVDAAETGIGTLRFYQWDEPTLSLGYFQRYDDRLQHAASRGAACVRRQSGGGAIMHDRELTYSLVLPADHPLARDTKRLYASMHDSFITALWPQPGGVGTGWRLRRRDRAANLTAAQEPFLCFQRRAVGDVVLEKAPEDRSAGDGADWKILGSAQRRHRGAVLQHGSLLLHRSEAAPELAGFGDLSGQKVEASDVVETVAGIATGLLGLEVSPSGFPPQLELKAQDLANNKYGAAGWTNRR